MSKLVALVALSVVVVAGCKKKTTTTAAPATGIDAAAAAPEPAVDAAPPPVDAAEDPEAARRAGKKTGLGAADEPVEVATEDLIKALAAKKIDAARLIDPAIGVYEIWNMPGGGEKSPPKRSKRHCGAKAAELVAKEAAFWIDRQKRYPDEPDMYSIECSNEFVAAADPAFGAIDEDGDSATPPTKPGHALKYAYCYEHGAGEYDDSPSMYFVPDASGQLKIAGILTTEVGAMDYAEVNELADQLAKTGKLCK
jgi:hypothetical protein